MPEDKAGLALLGEVVAAKARAAARRLVGHVEFLQLRDSLAAGAADHHQQLVAVLLGDQLVGQELHLTVDANGHPAAGLDEQVGCAATDHVIQERFKFHVLSIGLWIGSVNELEEPLQQARDPVPRKR